MENRVTIGSVPPPEMKIDWRRGWRALRILLADAERTEQAFEIISALSGRDFERLNRRFVAHPDGAALLAERSSLLAALADRARLRALPPGSFGRAYADFMDAAGLDAEGLVMAQAASQAGEEIDGLDPDRQWIGHRLRDMHDLWHVLTGYGRDEAGEAANLAFSYAQLRFRGILVILVAVAFTRPYGNRFAWPGYLWRAWQRGRRAAWLPVAPLERLLSEPLEVVRGRLAIDPATVAHPGGVIVARREDEGHRGDAHPATGAMDLATEPK